jgi:hypothetical protein
MFEEALPELKGRNEVVNKVEAQKVSDSCVLERKTRLI